MNKSSSQRRNQALWITCLAALASAGCIGAAPEHDAQVGKLEVPLVSTGSRGTQFALAGSFSLSDPELLSVTVSPMDPDFTSDAVLSMSPRVGGPYDLTLSGWALYELGNTPTLIADATLLSPATLPVTIVANQTTTATFAFAVPGSGTVVFQRGTLDIDFTVSEQGNPDGTACENGSDCESGLCSAGVCVVEDGPATLACVKINEVSPTGPGGGSDEFVELYNTCNAAVDLSNARLVYRSVNANTDSLLFAFAAGAIILGNEYQVYANGTVNIPTAIPFVAGASGLAADGGGVALRDATLTIVDSVGYTRAAIALSNGFIEGTAAAAPLAPASISRSPNGADTNDNSLDFQAQPRTPGAPNM